MKFADRVRMILLGMAAGALAFPLATSATATTPQVHAESKAAFTAAAADIRKEMVPGGRFQFVTGVEVTRVNTSLDAIGALFEKYGTLANMDKVVKVTLFNDQEVVNSILAERDDLRLICKPKRATGTRIPVTECKTYGDIQRERADTHNALEQYYQRSRQEPVPQG